MSEQKNEKYMAFRARCDSVNNDSIISKLMRLFYLVNKIETMAFFCPQCLSYESIIKLILKRQIEWIILHIGTNNARSSSPNELSDIILALKKFIVNSNKSCNVIMPKLIMRVDSQKPGLVVSKFNRILKKVNVQIKYR